MLYFKTEMRSTLEANGLKTGILSYGRFPESLDVMLCENFNTVNPVSKLLK